LGLLGLRVSEACNVPIQDTHGLERGHRTLTLVGKGRKPATIPLPLPVAEVMDAAAGERGSGPLLLRADGKQMDRRAATRFVMRPPNEAPIKTSPPRSLVLWHLCYTFTHDEGCIARLEKPHGRGVTSGV
jgi:integrase/recombinase XerD